MSAFSDERWRHLAPVHTWRVTATVVLVAVPLMAVGALMIRGNGSATLPNLKPPKNASAGALPPPTTLPASLTGIQLPGVNGSTTVPPINLTGDAKIGGAVNGPSGPVPGAIVHAERVDGGYTNDFTTGADARYLFEGLPGGRYRVRAYMPPTYAQTDSELIFLGAEEMRPLDLTMQQFNQLAVTAAVAPSPPMVGQSFNLVVRIAIRTVDSGGVVRSTPLPGAIVVVGTTGTLVVNAVATATTGADGTVTYLSSCRGPGALAATVSVRAKATDTPQTVALDLPACEPAATTTTSTPGSGSSTTTTTTAPRPKN